MTESNPAEPLLRAQVSSSTRVRLVRTALLLLLVGVAILRSHIGTRLDGFTYDEPWHIVAGAEYVRTGNFRLNPEHPPLVKLVAGAALPATFRLPPAGKLTEKAQEREYVERVMFLQNGGLAVQGRVRAALWVFHGALLMMLALLVWKAFGFAWALGTTAFLAIDPTVGAYMPVAMTDLALGLTLAAAAVSAGILAGDWRWRWVGITGVAMGLALASKHSALPGLAGIAFVLLLLAATSFRDGGTRAAMGRTLRAVAAGVLAFVVLWASYGFRFHAAPDGSDGFNREIAAKIGDVQLPHWRRALEILDGARLLPRAYIWGLSDTIRAGVEGRGQSLHTVWGTNYELRPPLHTWPSFIIIKLPLASMAMALLGIVLLTRLRLSRHACVALWMLVGMSVAHLLALMTSQASYAGVRHAFPIVTAIAIAAGALGSLAWQRRSRALLATTAILLAASLAMTAGEPRILGYHNELVGGSENAFRLFANEGLGMGQRFPEIRAFYESTVKPTGLPLYLNYWLLDEELEAAKIHYRKRVESLHDANPQGVYEGFFVYHMGHTLRWPDSDPREIFRGLTMVARFGDVGVWRGRQVLPRARAYSMYRAVVEYLYEEGGRDHALVAARLEEVLAQAPHHIGASVELGNAYLKLGARDKAARGYRVPLDQTIIPVDALVRTQLESQIAKLESGEPLPAIAPLRNPWME